MTLTTEWVAALDGFVNAQTKINNLPGDPNTLVSVPNDSRYHFAEDRYQRINGQAVMQFKPTDTLTLTADALYAQTKEREQRSDESNWFNRPFNVVTFDNGGAVATTVGSVGVRVRVTAPCDVRGSRLRPRLGIDLGDGFREAIHPRRPGLVCGDGAVGGDLDAQVAGAPWTMVATPPPTGVSRGRGGGHSL